jgi:regulator of chromosome condensation
VYTWGCADDGSLGRTGDENAAMLVDSLVEMNVCVVNMACGDGQTIAVTSEGKVYGWGCYKDKEGKKWFSPSPGVSKPADDIKKQQNTPMLIEVRETH